MPNQRKIVKIVIAFLLCIVLSACTGMATVPSPTQTLQILATITPEIIKSANLPATLQRSPTFTSLLQSSRTSTSTIAVSSTPIPTYFPSITPSATLVPVVTPQVGADSYRLKPWDKATALRMIEEAGQVPISLEYEDLRQFYQISLLYETMLDFPDLSADPALNYQMAQLKPAWHATYGLLHDNSAEPYRRTLERALNDGTTQLSNLSGWVEKQEASLVVEPFTDSNHLFDQPTSARVIKILDGRYVDFFIIRTVAPDRYSVFSLYPDWKPLAWSDEAFQITDLNANGRGEIAVTHDGWGTGMSHFCQRSFELYEWDGTAFRDLMADPLEVYMETDFGNCLDITFPPDPRGGQKIQAGTSRNTLCPETPFLNLITFHWVGKDFRQESARTSPPPITNHPSRCTIDWAITAGPSNVAATDMLASALVNWPVEAEQEWGPAARDFFTIKLAVWNIKRGQLERGLDLLRQVRNHPALPAASFPQQVAATFLDAYKAKGFYGAITDVHTLYLAEMKTKSLCGIMGCNIEKIRQTWGYAEPDWGFEYYGPSPDEFESIDALSLALKLTPPTNLDGLYAWLDRNGLQPEWSVQADLDGQGQQDWLVEIRSLRGDFLYHNLFAFMRQGGQIKFIPLNDIYLTDGSPIEIILWQNFRPVLNAPPVNILQVDSRIYAFRIISSNGNYQMKVDLDSWMIFGGNLQDHAYVQDWKIKDNQLIVEYDGRQAIYAWDAAQGQLVPTGYAPDLQQENVRKAEQALFVDQNPARAQKILNELLAARIWEDYVWNVDAAPPRVRPYLLYLLGLAYERSGEQASAVNAYWQLWHDYPACPYSLDAQSKLERQ